MIPVSRNFCEVWKLLWLEDRPLFSTSNKIFWLYIIINEKFDSTTISNTIIENPYFIQLWRKFDRFSWSSSWFKIFFMNASISYINSNLWKYPLNVLYMPFMMLLLLKHYMSNCEKIFFFLFLSVIHMWKKQKIM